MVVSDVRYDEIQVATEFDQVRDRRPESLEIWCRQSDELRWHVEAIPLDRANEALDRVCRGDVAGRLVLTP
jgi:D-arabinose 1-dehydrogenase-like Zn-dependent alcohol dehydrogenase